MTRGGSAASCCVSVNHGVSFEVTSLVYLGAKQEGGFVQERAILTHVSNSRTKPSVPALGSKADVIDSYGIEEAFDLGGIYERLSQFLQSQLG